MKLKRIPIVITLFCAGALFSAVAYNGNQMQHKAQQSAAKQAPSYPQVKVTAVTPASYHASVQGYGETMPQYRLTLTSQVSAQVINLSESFATGHRVQAGELLATLEDSHYQRAVSDAEKAVADAKLALLEEQRQGKQALLEWQGSGLKGEPDSPLVLRKPQLEAAQALLKQAQQQLASAKVDLDNTELRAPFDAVIVSRAIQPGSYLQQGSEIAELYSTGLAEIRIPLSQHQFQSLGQLQVGSETRVLLTSSDDQHQWQGYAARIEQHLDSSDRQRSLVVAVADPLDQAHPLHAGTFVTATITGAPWSNLWQLPASVVSQDNTVWLLSENNTIKPTKAIQAFADTHWVYLQPITDDGAATVVVRPLNNYLSGMRIDPIRNGQEQ